MSKRLNKIVQLDALRAFAAFAVIFHHFLPDCNLGNFAAGQNGVDLFFVISGFLITAILLNQKEAISGKLLIIKNFVIKRALRLFPAYYLFITALLVLSLATGMYLWQKGDAVFYYTYTQNILFFKEGLKAIQTNHLWTLAVEEQFYLIWPWFVIFISNNKLIGALLIIIPATLLFKLFSATENVRFLTFWHFDTLGAGALLALLQKEMKTDLLAFLNKIKIPLILASLTALLLGAHYQIPGLVIISVLILSVCLLIGCMYGYKGFFGAILNTAPLIYLGQISYGLYLYHKPIPYFIYVITERTRVHFNGAVQLTVSLVLTVMIAHLSYVILEKRLLALKAQFDL